MLIAQITDCHVVEPGELVADRVDTAAGLRRAIATVHTVQPRPDVVLATGDLVNDGRSSEYDHLASILAELEIPVLPVPGNHDDRGELRRRFPVLPPGDAVTPIDYVVDDFEVRLIGLDTLVPGEIHGRLMPDQTAWLDDRLSEAPDAPTLIFQHHPPFATGIGWMDEFAFVGADLLAGVVARHGQVEGIVCGHVHRSIQTRFGGTVASCWPSTGPHVALELAGGPVAYSSEPPAFALHRWEPGAGLTSHLVTVGNHLRWTPSWALPAVL